MRIRPILAASVVFLVLSLVSVAAAANPNPPVAHPGKTFVLFHQTWCVGDVGPLVSCDVTIAGARTQPVHAKAMLTTPGPLEQLRELVRRAAATTTSLSATDKAVRLHQLLVPKTQAAKP